MKKPEVPQKQGNRRRYVGIAVAVTAPVIVFGVLSHSGNGGDAAPGLPPDEQFIRDTVQSFDPTQSTLQRLGSVRNALQNLDRLPQVRREEVIIEAMAAGVNRNLELFRALPADQKDARAKLLYQDALQTRSYFRRLPSGDRRRARELLSSQASGRAQLERAAHTVLNVMTPEERAMLNPVFVVWKSMLEDP